MGQIIDNATHYGILLSGFNATDRVTISNTIGCKYLRDQVILADFDGSDNALDTLIAAKKRLILNINADHTQGAPPEGKHFRTDESLYRSQLSAVLDAYQPEVAIIENEPTNGVYYNVLSMPVATAMQPYLNMLAWAIDECHKRNIKVADGCTHFEYYDDIMNPPTTNAGAQRAEYLLNGYASLDLDFQNFHFSIPSILTNGSGLVDINRFKNILKFAKSVSGKIPMVNEYTQTNNDPALTSSAVAELRRGHPRYIVPYSNDPLMTDGDGFPFANSDLSLTTIGLAYKAAIAAGVS